MNIKKTDAEIIDRVDKIIAELVVEKERAVSAYNYYNGVMDEKQFAYLEENYGIGSPTSVKFIPMIKKHIDALVGEYISFPLIPTISCKDEKTISKIDREKKIKITQGVIDEFKNKLVTNLTQFIMGKGGVDENIQNFLKATEESLKEDFVSDYEIAAQDVLTYLTQSEVIDLKNKLIELCLEFLITGECYFRVVPTPSETDVEIEIISTLNAFPDINISKPVVKKSHRSVVRKWYSLPDLLLTYGEFLTQDQIENLTEKWGEYALNRKGGHLWVERSLPYQTGYPSRYGINADRKVVGTPYDGLTFDRHHYNNFIPVYEVEWLETFKQKDGKYKVERYSQVRIGAEIYIITNEPDENVYRSVSDSLNASISLNGIYFVNKQSAPFSLVLACADLQDDYNILWFYRDTIISRSGTSGERLDLAKLPKALGSDLTERLLKWNAYYRNGIALYDSSQEGEVGNNTILGTYDNTLKLQSIQAITAALESIEQTCSSITGVFRERLNGIQQYDAVRNVQVGVKNSYTVTKHYFQKMDMITKEMLIDALNVAKVVFKKGITGTLVLGDERQKIFTAKPEYFTITDHDIHILSATEASEELEKAQVMASELIKSGAIDADILVDTLNTKSVTDFKDKLKKALKTKERYDQQFAELSKQLEQAQNTVKEYEKQLKEAQTKLQKMSDAEMQLKQAELEFKKEVEWFKAKTEREYYKDKTEIDREKIKIEIGQLFDGNPYNDKVKMD